VEKNLNAALKKTFPSGTYSVRKKIGREEEDNENVQAMATLCYFASLPLSFAV
jgi:hypothetical protein